jgi:hypothetical protein
MFATFVLLALAQVSQEQETLAERAFRMVSDPANPEMFKFMTEPVQPPQTMPELPAYLRLERSWQTGKKCGPVALFFLLRCHGRNVTLDDVHAITRVGEKGSSMADLHEAAAWFGLKTRIIKIVPEELSGLPKPLIIHWATGVGNNDTNGHFDVLVREQIMPDSSSYYEIIDTTSCIAQRISAQNAGPRLSGYALIVDPLSNWWYLAAWGLFGVLLAVDLALAGAFLYRDFRRKP